MSYQPPSYYTKTLEDLNKQYYSTLENISTLFPKTKLYPEFKAYSKPFTKDMTELNKLQTDFFLFKNGLETDIDHLDKDIKIVNEKITKFETENKKLNATLISLESSNDASYGMLQDTKLLYNQLLTGNWMLFLIIIGFSYTYVTKVPDH